MVVLDSWALLAYLKDEPAAGRIESEWIESGAAICSINLGEVLLELTAAVAIGLAVKHVLENREAPAAVEEAPVLR